MRLHGMAKALRQWMLSPKDVELRPKDLVGLLVDAEWVHRENTKLTSRLRKGKFKQSACIEDIIYKSGRGVTKELAQARADGTYTLALRRIAKAYLAPLES